MSAASWVRNADIVVDHLHRDVWTGRYPALLEQVLSVAMAEEALAEIGTWPGYRPTPLLDLDRLASALGIGRLFYKDEGGRFGLGSFKALGGAYAVLRVAADEIERADGARPSFQSIREGEHGGRLAGLTVVTATDGNHGRSVAWGAQMIGCRCRIYIHAGVSIGREQAMVALGAEVVRVAGDYDESLRVCAREAADRGWTVVSDTSWPGYMDLPRNVMAGYSVMASEVLAQLAGTRPSHLFVQAGVGGVAAAVCARVWQVLGDRRPRMVVVEPERAACVIESARLGRPVQVAIGSETVMAGLSCGEVSLLAWEILSRGCGDFVTIGEDEVAPAMRLLASGEAGGGSVVAGESAVAGLIALIGAAANADLMDALELGPDSRVVVFGCEGATDAAIYASMIGDPERAFAPVLADG
jgi:diaminopropionate ammonia-lyase